MFSKMLCGIEKTSLFGAGNTKSGFYCKCSPEFEEYSGDSPKIVSNVVENVVLRLL